MALTVDAGNYVQVNITLENVGQQIGTFQVTSVVVPNGGQVADAVQTFYTASGYNPTNPPPAGANIFETPPVAPNAQATAIMYTNQWANGDPLTYSTQQLFDVIFQVTVLETAQTFTFRGEDALQHQVLAPASPNIVGVDYVISAQTGAYYQ